MSGPRGATELVIDVVYCLVRSLELALAALLLTLPPLLGGICGALPLELGIASCLAWAARRTGC